MADQQTEVNERLDDNADDPLCPNCGRPLSEHFTEGTADLFDYDNAAAADDLLNHAEEAHLDAEPEEARTLALIGAGRALLALSETLSNLVTGAAIQTTVLASLLNSDELAQKKKDTVRVYNVQPAPNGDGSKVM